MVKGRTPADSMVIDKEVFKALLIQNAAHFLVIVDLQEKYHIPMEAVSELIMKRVKELAEILKFGENGRGLV